MGLAQSGQFVEAEKVAIYLVRNNPLDLEVWFALGQILRQLGKLEPALHAFTKVLGQKTKNYVRALQSITDICIDLAHFEQGAEAAKQWLEVEPKAALPHYQRGFFLLRQKRVVEAIKHFEAAVGIKPDDEGYRLSWAEALAHAGYLEKALEQFEKITQLNESNDLVVIKSLMMQNYSHERSDLDVFSAHQKYGQHLEKRFPSVQPFAKDQKHSRIRVGYVSADFRSHSVSYFFIPIVEAHNREKFEVYCYSNVKKPDTLTAQIKESSDHWCDALRMSDDQLFNQIRKDEIDILVDLTGYTGAHPRMGLYARKAAPIQVTYLGYPNTSGLSRMDYRIVDAISDPIGISEELNTEKLIRMPNSFLCFSSEGGVSDVNSVPDTFSSKVTFGSFNSYLKITDEILRAWSEMLRLTPNSQLYVKAEVLSDSAQKEEFIARCQKVGIERPKLLLEGHMPNRYAHFCEYHKVDLHLDTYPYNGTTTTLEALWMGVPTVTLSGKSHRSRVGASILSALKMEDYIADSIEKYIELALAKVADIKKLRRNRKTLRPRLEKSTLMDREPFVRGLESKFEEMINQLGMNT